MVADQYENILICFIQILLNLDDNLSSYYNQVLNGSYKFPSYKHWCPICGGKNCARFHCYYYRQVIDENGNFIKDFPIARFICLRKGKKNVKDRTFSLLPWQLIPYRKYMIDFLLAVASYQVNHSNKQTLDLFYHEIKESSQLYSFKKLLIESLEKLKINQMISPEVDFMSFIDYCQEYISERNERIRGPTVLSWDYYLNNGGYYENSQFLFGCAAQFC